MEGWRGKGEGTHGQQCEDWGGGARGGMEKYSKTLLGSLRNTTGTKYVLSKR